MNKPTGATHTSNVSQIDTFYRYLPEEKTFDYYSETQQAWCRIFFSFAPEYDLKPIEPVNVIEEAISKAGYGAEDDSQ